MGNRPTLDIVAARCYEAYCNMSGDQTSPPWDGLTVAQREIWRRVVEVAWGQDKPIKGDDTGGSPTPPPRAPEAPRP